MNQINLDKIFQLSPGHKADPAAVKLAVAQVYQAQVQQLSNGRFGLQIPTARVPLHITLPANLPADMQAMLQASIKTPANMPTLNPQPNAPRANVQLQFLPQSNGQIQLILQPSANPHKLTLSATQVQQLLSSVLSGVSSGSLTRFNSQPTSTQLPLNILQLNQDVALQLGRDAIIQLPARVQAALMQQLSDSGTISNLSANTKTALAPVLLDIKADRQQLLLQLQIQPGITKAGTHGSLNTVPVTLNKTEQSAVLHQLLQLFNQPARSSTPLPSAAQHMLAQLTGNVTLQSQPFQMQLQQQANQWQLLLQPEKTSASVTITPNAISKPLQFHTDNSALAKAPPHSQQTPLTQNAQQLVQQAWRHLLPLLPLQTDTLASLPELPPAVQQILHLVRHSQPGADKVLSPQQMANQLSSLLQFQPLQVATATQTSGGTLAAAIQLLLGHLLQKPLATPAQPGHKALSQLISQLEPGQASNLLRQLAGHSSTMQQSQLATLDNNTQTQQLLLQLPMQQGEHSVFSQLLLEQREADGKEHGEKQTLWQLTMKFDLKQLGQLMVVAKLQQQQLQLQLYAEEMQAKQQAERFLPLLTDRCKAQGLEVTHAECTLGKIPDTILPRANSLLAIKV